MKYILLFIITLASTSLLVAQKDTILNINTVSSMSQTGDVFIDVEQKPEFPGGKKELIEFYRKLSTFEICNKGDNCKAIYYQVIVDTLGNIGGFNIIKGLDDIYDNETERIVKAMPKWKPGKKEGIPVRVLVTLDIKYKIE